MPQFYDSRGNAVGIGKELGRGGEGSVFAIANTSHSEFVAKIYHHPVDQEKSAKLATMAALGKPRLTQLAAWPVATLHTKQQGPICGFIMPKVPGKPIHELYSPKSRLQSFPSAGWAFLVHAAANVARAVAAIHDHNHVIGDINQNTFFVSDNGTVMLIDCDSFQVSSQGHHFLCEVGVDTYTPPELQGRSFKGIIRTQNHDCFGLAVLIFHLLFMGRHPFDGRYSGQEVKTLDKLIAENRFAYGDNASSRQMSPPLGTLPLSFASQPIATLFERAFLSSGNASGARPKPQQWIDSLSKLGRELRVCSSKPSHQLPRIEKQCPWCIIEAKLHISLFGLTSSIAHNTNFLINSAWAQIIAVKPPTIRECPAPNSASVEPALKFSEAGNKLRRSIGIALLLKSVREIRNEAKSALDLKKSEYDKIAALWKAETDVDIFMNHLALLNEKKNKYHDLENDKDQRIKKLTEQTRVQHLDVYLRSFNINSARIAQVGPARMSKLRSAGVITAADITRTSIGIVNHYGAESNLLFWKQQIESRFVFDANKALKQASPPYIF